MQAGVWTSFLIDQTPEEMIQTFAAQQWFRLELSDEHAQVLLGRGAPAATGQALRAAAESYGVAFPQGHLWLSCDLCARDERFVLDTLRRWLDLFVALGVRAAVLHPGGRELTEEGASPAAIQSIRVKRLALLCQHIRGSEMSICLENVGNCGEIDDLLAIVGAVGQDNLGICLDTGHLNMGSRDQAGFIRAAGSHLRAMHLADNEGQTDQHLMPYGRGTVDWGTVMASLGAIRYGGLLNLEVPGESHGVPLAIRLAKLDYLHRVMDYLVGLASAGG